MSLPLNQYVKVKDRYCISYLGPSKEYIQLLSYLRPAIEAELPGIQIYLCCRKEFLPNTERVFDLSELNKKKNEMAYIRELTCDLVNHPIEMLINESLLKLNYWHPPILKISKGNRYVFCPNGTLPTKSLTSKQVDLIKKKLGPFEISNNIEDADWVVGVENECLFKAAMLGIRTTLVPTGLGTNLYKKIFPNGEILNLWNL
jgi:hypothetical protein